MYTFKVVQRALLLPSTFPYWKLATDQINFHPMEAHAQQVIKDGKAFFRILT
jgi:hypothetical protein